MKEVIKQTPSLMKTIQPRKRKKKLHRNHLTPAYLLPHRKKCKTAQQNKKKITTPPQKIHLS
jgi:hypothetical protein